MGWLADRSVGVKNLVTVAVVAAVAIGIGVLSMARMSELNANVDKLETSNLESMAQLVQMRQGVGEMYRGLSLYGFSVSDPQLGPLGRQTVRDADAMIQNALTTYRDRTAGSAARQTQVEAFSSTFTRYTYLRNSLVFQEKPPAGVSLPTDYAAQSKLWEDSENAMNAALATLQKLETDEAKARTDEGNALYNRARLWVIGLLVVGLVVALLFGLWVNRLMTAQLRSVATSLSGMASGDLTRRAEVRARDELGSMADSVNRAADGIRSTLETLTSGAHTLGQSAEQLAQVTVRIGQSAQEAADQANIVAGEAGTVSQNVQTVAAGAEQMNASIRESSVSRRPRSATWSRRSRRSPSRPTCSRSTRRSRRPGPATPARASPWSRARSRTWRRRPRGPPRTSPVGWRRSSPTPPTRSRPSPRSAGSSRRSTTTS
ncbi:hypothetical protein GCM10009557_72760 [Virgisporangium ochraceum]